MGPKRAVIPHWQFSHDSNDVLSLYPMNSLGCRCGRHPASSGRRCTLPCPPRTASSAATAGSSHHRLNAAARTAAVPDVNIAFSNTLSSYTGSNPSRRISAVPRSNSSRLKALAGDTMAIRSPRLRAGGLITGAGAPCRARSREPRHFVGDAPMRLAADDAAQLPRAGCNRGGKESLLGAALPGKSVLEPLVRNPPVFDRMHQRLQHRRLHFDVAASVVHERAAHEHAITAGSNGLYCRVGHLVRGCE